MSAHNTDQPSEIEISAVIHRVDGTVIDLGIIDAHYEDAAKQAEWEKNGLPEANRRIRKANRQSRKGFLKWLP